MDLTKLNDKQKEAVLHINGPLLILAGAGSGKTSVLTTRVAYLVKEIGIPPYNILAITFTNKAAKEMKERIIKLIGDEASFIQISTFHSFGYLILRNNYKKLGFESNFTILDENDSVSMIKKILKELNIDPKRFNPKAIKSAISGAKNELMDVDMYSRYVKTPWDELVIKVYRIYQDRLKSNNAVDFDDLLMLPIVLFKNNPDVLNYYQDKYNYILIDEYQDTNEAQYTLTKMISEKYKNICVVGDNDQAIYSFRGANYNNILNFEKDYQNTKVIVLEQNYRSTKNILDAANSLIKNNRLRKDKNLWTNNDSGHKIKYYQAFDEKEEADYVVRKARMLHEEGIPYDNMAVLYRTNAQSRVLEEQFMMGKVPYKVVGSYSFYNRKEIKDLVAYLRLIYNTKDNVSLLRCINTPKRGIGPKTLEQLELKSLDEEKSIYEVIDSGRELGFKTFIEDAIKYAENNTLTDLVEYILEYSGLRDELKTEKTPEADARLENLEEFKSLTQEFEEREENIVLEQFLMQISLVSNSDDLKEEYDKISLMTMHAAKGLEFDVVFAVGIEDGIIPHSGYDQDNSELEEERRLFYVAITRAKKQLFIINTKIRMLFGNRNRSMSSSFIKEIDNELIENLNDNKKIVINDDNVVDSNYQIGDKVKHKVFGEGVVVKITKDIIHISFPYPHYVKQIMSNHKSLSKV